ncbi:hypothetical protein GCM10007973_18070 [Polymorphobacter multimanifer]|uniref:ASCH domain-containing protein n=1 Tax=Polymorphobacter multimanifer TaxID=1070431 RepID=A0A841L9L5_9SPHN|nr:ASCH domain-containing protein [Polymorphobacter multimanifer]MBB6228321.1 hypothetical protein [Polymorphobacter multimanifer]GGI82025.1 hypothetical protein GCM10007973_18070 [Polymorphobacter multimanifer]
MKALTIFQPWASLIIIGAKPFEFRGWRPPSSLVGQRLVVHAAAREVDTREVHQLVRLLEAGGRFAAHTCLKPDLALPLLRDWMNGTELPLAAGLGTAIVGVARLGTEISAEFGLNRANDSDRDMHSNWGWPMQDIERWEHPFSMKGAQGLWTWPDAERMAG